MKYEEITDKIIEVFYKVYNKIGYGFLERVYAGAMKVEFDRIGLTCVREMPIKVNYEGVVVGEYLADFLIEDKVLVEVKAIREITGRDEMQLLNYLRATDAEVGLLLNFGERPEVKRKICSNS
jgi:GxxExxY protein